MQQNPKFRQGFYYYTRQLTGCNVINKDLAMYCIILKLRLNTYRYSQISERKGRYKGVDNRS